MGPAIDIPGKTPAEKWRGLYQLVGGGWADTLGLRIPRGRMLWAGEVAAARKVAVVNQTLVTKYFGGEAPIGRQITIEAGGGAPNVPPEHPVFDIVGVISDAKNDGIRDPVRPELLVPYTITGQFQRGILV